MTSYEFEVIAKEAVCAELEGKFDINAATAELDFVWFAHELGYKKCTIWGKPMGKLYAEVTYNKANDEIYVDIYHKRSNAVYPISWFNGEDNKDEL